MVLNNYFNETNITNGFWKEMQKRNREITIRAVYDRFEETGRIKAMKCQWKKGEPQEPHFYWDSDVAKWIEGAAYILAKHEDVELEAKVESIIDDIEANQDESGYYNIYYTVIDPENRFKHRLNHELYCAGHLFEAAVAYYEATGKDRFLNCMTKYADLIYKVFVEDKSAGFITPGHEEIELALLRLYRCTKNHKYLELCKFFVENRGKHNEEVYDFVNEKHGQDHLPVREMNEAHGHAVRAVYLYTAMADLALETGDTELFTACETLFKDITTRKMAITGGIGASHINEAFTVPYDLPNETSYNETCASIGLMFFADKMLSKDMDSKYSDTIERLLYNGIISGLSIDGTKFFYENPLEVCLRNHNRNVSTKEGDRLPITQRQKEFWCSCCPPNINRTFSSVEKYIYGKKEDVYYVHQFMDSTFDDGKAKVVMKTDYPLNGEVEITCENVKKLAVRIPWWCKEFSINAEYEMEKGYAYIDNPQDIKIFFVMKPVLYMANREVSHCSNKVAFMYGPVVYCAEGVDNSLNLHSIYIDKNIKYEASYNKEYLLNEFTIAGFKKAESNVLYSELNDEFEAISIKLIPYYAFANRGESDMVVWLNYK